jgi:hypothetical protein
VGLFRFPSRLIEPERTDFPYPAIDLSDEDTRLYAQPYNVRMSRVRPSQQSCCPIRSSSVSIPVWNKRLDATRSSRF